MKEKARLIDAHCHYDAYQGQELVRALQETRAYNILTLSTSMDPEAYMRACEIARDHPLIIPCFGIHPWNAYLHAEALDAYSEQIKESRVLGEIGLDFHFVQDPARHSQQRRVLEFFLECAKTQNKPINLHTKGAEAEVLKYLYSYGIKRFIIHWYSGDLALVDRFLELGGYFTVGTAVLRSPHIQGLADLLPADRILTETDNPGAWKYQTRERGMPSLVQSVAQKTAELRRMDQEEFQTRVEHNLSRYLSG